MIRRTYLFVLLLTAVMLFAACGPEEAEVATVPTRTPRPTFTPTPFVQADQPAPQTEAVVPPVAQATNTPAPEVETPAQPSTDASTDGSTQPATEAPTNTPESPTATPEPVEAKAVVNSPQVNVRSGPGTEYSLAGTADRGTEFTIQGKNAAEDWWQVCCVNGQTVWIASFLVDTSGPLDAVSVAANIPAPPPPTATSVPQPAAPTAAQPAAPTATPAPAQPTQPPAPTFRLNKGGFVDPRPNSNPYVTFYGWICKQSFPCSPSVGGYTLVVDGPSGTFRGAFSESTQDGDPGLPSQFWYNVKVEIPNGPPGTYRAYVTDGSGNQISEAWEYEAQGQIRTFLPRWLEP